MTSPTVMERPSMIPSRTSLIPPPLRADPTTPDNRDEERINYWRRRWHGQDDARRQFERTAEEMVRMICGQQWATWNSTLQRMIDVGQWFGDKERWWRMRPSVNRMFYWYVLTHARMTENPAILSFMPATGDRFDGMLAEVLDPIIKAIWRTGGMDDAMAQRAAWLITTGEGYTLTHFDQTRGELKPRIGPAMLPMMGPTGPVLGPDGNPIELYAETVPYDRDGNPQAIVDLQGNYRVTGEPFYDREGEIVFSSPCSLQVRGQWGQVPWHLKPWHMLYVIMSVEEIYERYGVAVPAEGMASTTGLAEIARLTMGSGWFGSTGGDQRADMTQANFKDGYAGVWIGWEKPNQWSPETPDNPGGRMSVFTVSKLLYDGPRNAPWPYTSPLRRYPFVQIPGRPAGSSPAEIITPVQRTYNTGYKQIMEYRQLCTNPVTVIDQLSGIDPKQLIAKPGLVVKGLLRTGVHPIQFINPGRLGEEVFRSQELLRREMQDFGYIEGSEGRTPTSDASGELIKELRFNSDRSIGPTLRQMAIEDARLAEDILALMKVTWDEEKVIVAAGEDQVATTITVYPEMFKLGRVNVIPDLASAQPESPQERQQRWLALYEKGVFGPVGSPEATQKYLEAARYPHLGRSMTAGSVDAVTANQENGELARGVLAAQVMTFEWYNHEVHLLIHERFMKSPEFKRLPPPIQMQFMEHRMVHLIEVQKMMMQQLAMQAEAAKLGGPAAADAGGAPPQ